jgi:NAD dependent epimerase/dehydratase family enzyme
MGKIMSEEAKLKISNSRKGMKFSEEHKQKMRDANLGKKMSEEVKNKISKMISGSRHPLYGKHHSEESKQKMSESKKKIAEQISQKMIEIWAKRKFDTISPSYLGA